MRTESNFANKDTGDMMAESQVGGDSQPVIYATVATLPSTEKLIQTLGLSLTYNISQRGLPN